MARRVQLQKTVQKLLKIVSRVDFFFEDHLKHGLPEIFIRVVGIFDHGDAVLDFGECGVIVAVAGGGVDVVGEAGEGAVSAVEFVGGAGGGGGEMAGFLIGK